MSERPYRILIIEDCAEDIEAYRRRLRHGNQQVYEFWEAGTVREGLKLCREVSPDCILLDYQLPDMTGLEFLDCFHAEFPDSNVSVVMLTGQGNEAIAVKAMKLGVHDYLSKGIGSDNLGVIVQSAIYKTALRQQVAEQNRAVQDLSQERLELIHELQQKTASLTEEHLRKDQFLAMLAHELRNPLAPLRNGLQIMRIKPNDAATLQAVRPIMERQVDHLTRLVDDLLDVSRISHGKIQLVKEEIDLASLFQRSVETCQTVIDTQRHHLRIEMPAEAICFQADPVRAEQIISNLLNNAAKYTPPGGQIVLKGEVVENEVVMTVRDNGIGISAEMLPLVFDLFTQANHSLDRSQGGLGIGLTLVRLLASLHGGSVVAESAGLGRGTQFVVRLPASPKVEVDGVPTGGGPLGRAATLSVLVVDDNVDAAETLAMLIRLAGHHVTVAHNGKAALSILETCNPQVVFLDIGMPEMNGYEVAQEVRARTVKPPLLVAVSGYTPDETRMNFNADGFDYHEVKPLELDRLSCLLATAAE